MMKYFWVAMALLFGFSAGSWDHAQRYGEIRVFTNIEIPGDELNRGQRTIDITFPSALRPKYIWLPNGDIYPDDGKLRWIEVMPDGTEKTWLDRLSFEIADRPR